MSPNIFLSGLYLIIKDSEWWAGKAELKDLKSHDREMGVENTSIFISKKKKKKSKTKIKTLDLLPLPTLLMLFFLKTKQNKTNTFLPKIHI